MDADQIEIRQLKNELGAAKRELISDLALNRFVGNDNKIIPNAILPSYTNTSMDNAYQSPVRGVSARGIVNLREKVKEAESKATQLDAQAKQMTLELASDEGYVANLLADLEKCRAEKEDIKYMLQVHFMSYYCYYHSCSYQ